MLFRRIHVRWAEFNGCALLLIFSAIFSVLPVNAEQELLLQLPRQENSIKVSPKRCIALHQGQKCYQKIRLEWIVDRVGDYCLYQNNIEKPLSCWADSNSGKIKINFKSKSNTDFTLTDNQKNVVAQVTVRVAWVYAKKKKQAGGWRLF